MGDVVSQHHPKSHPDILFQYQGNLNWHYKHEQLGDIPQTIPKKVAFQRFINLLKKFMVKDKWMIIHAKTKQQESICGLR